MEVRFDKEYCFPPPFLSQNEPMFVPLVSRNILVGAIQKEIVERKEVGKRFHAPLGTVCCYSEEKGYRFITQVFGETNDEFTNGDGVGLYYRHHPRVRIVFFEGVVGVWVNGMKEEGVILSVLV